MSLLHETKRVLGQGTRPLGALVYWDNLKNVEVLRTTLLAGFDAAGLAAAVSTPSEPATVLGLAVNKQAHRRDADAQIDMVAKMDSEVVYAVLGHDVDGTGFTQWTERVRLRLDRTLARPVLQIEPIAGRQVTPAVDLVISEVAADYTTLLDYAKSTEVSSSLVRAMKVAQTIALRSGVYLAPLSAMPAIESLAKFIEKETKIVFSMWEIMDGDRNAATAKRDAFNEFHTALTDLRDEVDAFTASVKPDEANFRNVGAFVRRFKDLDGKVLIYADVLGELAESLRSSIDGARAALTKAYVDGDGA